MDVLGIILGVFLFAVWWEYPGSLVDDVVERLKKLLKNQ